MAMIFNPCNCEHTDHFDDERGPQTKHNHMQVEAGNQRSLYVGPVCTDCAETCVAAYIYSD